MGKVPRQRGGGQYGNTSWGHRSNRVSSTRRGGSPHAGGGGGGKKGCAVTVLALPAVVATLTAAGYGLAELL
jgi:hypothetical protein